MQITSENQNGQRFSKSNLLMELMIIPLGAEARDVRYVIATFNCRYFDLTLMETLLLLEQPEKKAILLQKFRLPLLLQNQCRFELWLIEIKMRKLRIAYRNFRN